MFTFLFASRGVAGLGDCRVGGAGFAVVDTLDADDLAGGCGMMGVTVTMDTCSGTIERNGLVYT